MTKVKVSDWIIEKNASVNEKYAINEMLNIGTVEKETEKAYLVSFNTAYGEISMWSPKSQCELMEEKTEKELTVESIDGKIITMSNGKAFARFMYPDLKVGDKVTIKC